MQKFPWQTALSELIRDPNILFDLLNLDKSLLPAALEVSKIFPLKVSQHFVSRMTKANLTDPLLRQVLPLGLEMQQVAGFSEDPLAEKNVNPVPGLLHKYPGRVLITLTGACAIHCRYCFRRYFPYSDNSPGKIGWQPMFNYIKAETSIQEIILSGGDPLVLPDHLLAQFTHAIEQIPHVKRIRIHTRLPIIIPARITDEFLAWLKNINRAVVFVVHVNHAQEINQDIQAVLQAIKANVTFLLNQSVLLRSINDEIETLIALSERLFSAGVMPYYLHMLDKVSGTHHFAVAESFAKKLHTQMTQRLPGYLVPKLVREEPGKLSKTLYL